jgi:D-alanyl-D-alanine carboxypeptidase
VRRWARTVGAVAILAVAGTGCVSLNGRLPPESLTTITPECRIVNDVADRLGRMIATAHSQGIFIWPETSAFLPPGSPVPPRIESCYRTYEMQEWWRGYYCSQGLCGYAAVPGTSRHGWGRAVDFQDVHHELTFSSPGYWWLAANAHHFGFYQPEWATYGGSAPEAWHWEASWP